METFYKVLNYIGIAASSWIIGSIEVGWDIGIAALIVAVIVLFCLTRIAISIEDL